MAPLRDYEEWHTAYDDPESTLSWRLGVVQDHIREAFRRHHASIRVVSACAGDARDVLGVLESMDDAGRVSTTLIEINAVLADRARARATALPGAVDVRAADAGHSSTYVGAVPADLVLLVGVFGNIDDDDLARTIAAAPQLCARGATLIWTRGREPQDRNDGVRSRFADAGFSELAYSTLERGSLPAVGVVRYDGPDRPLATDVRLFSFLR